MKNLCLTSIFCICAMVPSVRAAEQVVAPQNVCAQFKYEPHVNLLTSYGKLTYNTDYDRQELTEMGKQYGLSEPGMMASGLSLVGVDWSVSLNSVARVAENNSICILPMSLDVYVGFSNPTIYLDKNLQKGTCPYNLVLRHEHHHQQINVAALEHFLPTLKQEIGAKLKTVVPQNISSLSQSRQTSDKMNDRYIQIIAPLVDKFKATLLHEHQKLDNRRNYEYESTICKKFHRAM